MSIPNKKQLCEQFLVKPMLAAKADLTKIRYPVLVSPKLDGVRAVIVNGVVMSRTMKPIPNRHVQNLFGRFAYNGFDGELIVDAPTDKDVFRKTTSGVMSVDGKPNVMFYVFDNYMHHDKFGHRLSNLRMLSLYESMIMIEHALVDCERQLLHLEDAYVTIGFEGIMIRDYEGAYKHGRSTVKEGGLLKLKRFEDSEATILGTFELMHNHNDKDASGKRSSHKAGKQGADMLGALRVRDLKTGVEFEIGSGFTEAERVLLWSGREHIQGMIVKYKYFATGSKDKPRFPTFEGFRNPIDAEGV